jgi:hypothetical protein
MTNKEIFTQVIVENLGDAKFLRLLSQRCEIDYNEARSSSYDDDLILDFFNRYKFGHDRYFLTQSTFIKSALDGGLKVKIGRCVANDYPVPLVMAGRFSFTYHYGKSSNEITCKNTSLTRQQSSTINNSIVQPSLFDKPDFDINKLNQAEHIYANIIHGCGGNGLNFLENGFLRIAVPCLKRVNGKQQFFFVENIDLYKVLEILEAKDASKSQATPMVDVAIPQIKQRRA